MKILLLTFAIFVFHNALALDNKPDLSQKTGTLEIYVDELNSNEGYLRAQLFNTDKGQYFPDESDKAYKFSIVKIKNNKARIIFSNIPLGKYAVTIHHDENSNQKMDKTWLGMPDEGWGISTDVVPVFTLPSFDECSFDFNQDYLKYPVKIRYLP
jgi:uncharacterized protein (DUF2141 family)